MKKIIALAVASLSILAACGGNAHAQVIGPQGQAQFGNTTNMLTVDLYSARYVDMTAGAQKVTLRDGSVVTGAFGNANAFTFSDAAKQYANLGGNVYINLGESSRVYCQSGNSVIDWNFGGAEIRTDGCALASVVWGLSRR